MNPVYPLALVLKRWSAPGVTGKLED